MLPSGSWAAYDPDYYKKFYDKWKREYDAHVRALEKGIEKGFEGVEREGAQEVNAAEEMERAKVEIQELEERKALTAATGVAPAQPKMNVKVRVHSVGSSYGVPHVFCREQALVDEHEQGTNFHPCLLRRTRTARHWKRELLKVGGIARKLVISTVRWPHSLIIVFL